jgi:tetratricopeptide (TPR) repeat protein
VDWDVLPSRSIAEPAVWIAGLGLLALVAGAVALALAARHRSTEDAATLRVAAFGALWFFVTLSVTSSFVPLADPLVEHRVYLASWGVIAAVTVLAERLLAHGVAPAPRRNACALLGVFALWTALAVALHRRNGVWESPVALWTDAAAKSPAKPRASWNLGFALSERGRIQESVAAYRSAVELARGDPARQVLVLQSLSAVLLESGRADEAVEVLERAGAISPGHPSTYANLAVAAYAKRDLQSARAYAQRALLIDPRHGHALNLLGSVQLEEGDLDGARASFERAVALDPQVGIRSYNLGQVLERQGDRVGACAAWKRALDGGLDPRTRAELWFRSRERCGHL